MKKIFTPGFSDVTSLSLLFLILLLQVSCTARVEQQEQQAIVPIATTQNTSVILGVLEAPAGEVYFDLIAETADCLGENVWIGGKLESTDNLALSKTGALRKSKAYQVKELTATGLSTNHNYTFRDQNNALQAVVAEDGTIRLQLRNGALQLSTMPGDAPIVLAFQQTASVGDGTEWSCL